MKILVTGGTGFVGHHIVNYFVTKGHDITILDRSSFAGTQCRFNPHGFKHRKIKLVGHDLCFPINNIQTIKELGQPDYILHLAASSHVDRSIIDPLSFIQDNVVGTCNLLNWFRFSTPKSKFLYFSTDEVFGPASTESEWKLNEVLAAEDMKINRRFPTYQEWDRYNSSNPYAASKAGAEELCLAFANTYGLDIFITHTMNIIGEKQHPEKLLPFLIKNILANKHIKLHSNADRTDAPTRFFITPNIVAEAVDFLYSKAEKGEKYNIVGERELSSLEIARFVSTILGKENFTYELTGDNLRPGHDPRYALDGTKLASMGFKPSSNFWDNLQRIILWYKENPSWL